MTALPLKADNAINWDVLPDIDQETLKDIGVKAVGDRLRILKTIANLRKDQPHTDSPTGELPAQSKPSSETDHSRTSWSRQVRHGGGFKIPLGLHSGEIVVLAGGAGDNVEYDADGPMVPIAARMEQVAARWPGPV